MPRSMRAMIRARLDAGDRNLEMLRIQLEVDRVREGISWDYLRQVAREWQREQATKEGA